MIHNRLNLKGIKLIIFSVGQPELLGVRSGFASSGERQMIGRFMAGKHEFSGVKTIQDMEVILNGYDTLEYPIGSHCSFTKYYTRIAYLNGFRMKNMSEKILYCFKEKIKKETDISEDDFEVPMQSIPPTIGYILQSLPEIISEYDDIAYDYEIDEALINDAIDYSEYTELMHNIVRLPIGSRINVQ